MMFSWDEEQRIVLIALLYSKTYFNALQRMSLFRPRRMHVFSIQAKQISYPISDNP